MTITEDPGFYRRQVRVGLREARKKADRTQVQVATALEWSPSKIIRIENGSVNVSMTDLKALLDYYQVREQDIIEELQHAARISRKRAWWYEYQEIIRQPFAQLLSYENAASAISAYSPTIISSLLQTTRYAEALRSETVRDSALRARLIELMVLRQEKHRTSNDLKTSVVIDEAALRRWVGGPETMAEQIAAVIELARHPRINIRVLPFSAGAHPAMSGPFILLDSPQGDDDIVFFEGIHGDTISREDSVLRAEYIAVFKRIQSKSLSQSDSISFLRDVMEEYKAAA